MFGAQRPQSGNHNAFSWIDPCARWGVPIWQTFPDAHPAGDPRPIRCIHRSDGCGPLSVWLSPGAGTCEIRYLGGAAQCDLSAAQADIRIPRDSQLSDYYMAERLAAPIMRYLRGAVLLHASAVSHEGRAVALLAPSGVGKSTLVGALLRADSRANLLSDDVLSAYPCGGEDGALWALPAQSHIAMRHDMWKNADFAEKSSAFFGKSVLHIKKERCADAPVPIDVLIWIEKSERGGVFPVSHADFVGRLLRSRFSVSNEWQYMASYQFKMIMKLSRHARIYRCAVANGGFSEAAQDILSV